MRELDFLLVMELVLVKADRYIYCTVFEILQFFIGAGAGVGKGRQVYLLYSI